MERVGLLVLELDLSGLEFSNSSVILEFMETSFKLSPSDLTFLWDECPRCFYLKVVLKFNRPWSPFPKIFNRIDKLMKDYFEGKSNTYISSNLPDGHVMCGEKWVTSRTISLPNHRRTCYIKGKFDTLVKFDDSTYGIIDFKTSEAKQEHVAFYSRQLHAYAYALEHPAPGSLALSPVTKLGLLCVEPTSMDQLHDQKIAYIGDVTWLDCPKDEQGFLTFLDEVLTVLERPAPPAPAPKCRYCTYREAARSNNL